MDLPPGAVPPGSPVPPALPPSVPPSTAAAMIAARRAAAVAAPAPASASATASETTVPATGNAAAQVLAATETPATEETSRDLSRMFGIVLFTVFLAGAIGFPILALVWVLYSLPWLAGMFTVLFFSCIAGVGVLEYLRLHGWRYSMRQMFAGALVLVILGNICVALGYRQYQETWAQDKPLEIKYWPKLSLTQKPELAQRLIDEQIQPTYAELLVWREQAEYKERMVVRNGRYVREFAFAIGPPKLLGQSCLIVQIDTVSQVPKYHIAPVRESAWQAGED